MTTGGRRADRCSGRSGATCRRCRRCRSSRSGSSSGSGSGSGNLKCTVAPPCAQLYTNNTAFKDSAQRTILCL